MSPASNTVGYFISAHTNLRSFYSIYDRDNINYVFIPSDKKSLTKLLSSSLSPRDIISPVSPFSMRWWQICNPIYLYNWKKDNLKNIPSLDSLFFFDSYNAVNLFMLIEHYRKLGTNCVFSDAQPSKYVDIANKCIKNQLRKKYLNLVGMPLTPVACPFFDTYRYDHNIRATYLILKTWQEIKEIYFSNLDMPMGPKSLLIIDGPLQSIPGIMLKESLNLCVAFIEKMISEKWNIYIKGHPAYDYTSFDKTPLIGEVKIIPAEYPVEIFLGSFTRIINLCASSADKGSGNIEFHPELLVFTDETHKRNLLQVYNSNKS